MANFKTHITGSTLLGIAYGTIAYTQFEVPLGHCAVAAGLCSVAGMLPDLDHKLGIPLREMLCFVAIVVPMLMIRRFEEMGFTPEEMVFVSGVLYVLIRFVGGELFKRFTVHRGMWHSIPAADPCRDGHLSGLSFPRRTRSRHESLGRGAGVHAASSFRRIVFGRSYWSPNQKELRNGFEILWQEVRSEFAGLR